METLAGLIMAQDPFELHELALSFFICFQICIVMVIFFQIKGFYFLLN